MGYKGECSVPKKWGWSIQQHPGVEGEEELLRAIQAAEVAIALSCHLIPLSKFLAGFGGEGGRVTGGGAVSEFAQRRSGNSPKSWRSLGSF